MKLEVLTEHKQQIFYALVAGLRAYNFEHAGTETSKPLSVISRNEDGSLAGGEQDGIDREDEPALPGDRKSPAPRLRASCFPFGTARTSDL